MKKKAETSERKTRSRLPMDCDCCYRNSCGNFCSMRSRGMLSNKGKMPGGHRKKFWWNYMDHIPKQEYEEMYAMLHIEASGKCQSGGFVTRNSAIYEGIEVQNMAVQIIAYDEANGGNLLLIQLQELSALRMKHSS